MIDRQKIVNKIQQIVKDIDPTAETILYGSQARGEATANSDIDVLILLEGTGEKPSILQEESLKWPLYELELETGVLISPLLIRLSQMEIPRPSMSIASREAKCAMVRSSCAGHSTPVHRIAAPSRSRTIGLPHSGQRSGSLKGTVPSGRFL